MLFIDCRHYQHGCHGGTTVGLASVTTCRSSPLVAPQRRLLALWPNFVTQETFTASVQRVKASGLIRFFFCPFGAVSIKWRLCGISGYRQEKLGHTACFLRSPRQHLQIVKHVRFSLPRFFVFKSETKRNPRRRFPARVSGLTASVRAG